MVCLAFAFFSFFFFVKLVISVKMCKSGSFTICALEMGKCNTSPTLAEIFSVFLKQEIYLQANVQNGKFRMSKYF